MGDTPRVVGLDLSLTATGMALPDGTRIVPTRSQDPLGYRLDVIAQEIRWVLGDTGQVLAVIEDLPANAKSSGITGKVHGVAHYVLWRAAIDQRRDVSVATVPPAVLKKYATGKGTADKIAMVVAARDRLGYDGLDDNEADALWLQAMGLDALGCPLVKLPESHRVALAKVEWPALVAPDQEGAA